MTRKIALLSAGIIVGFGLAVGTLPAAAYTGQKFEKNAAIKMGRAREIALKAHPGKITDQELEKERGGRKRTALFLRYQERKEDL